MKITAIAFAAIVAAAAAAFYLRWLRPWHLRWGATDEEVAMALPGDDLVAGPHIVATRAITIHAPPADVWPWLVQMGRDRAGWYSYDRLDNEGKSSAREILPAFQHMEVGDVVAMGKSKGKVFGPIVLSVDEPCNLLWGDDAKEHTFTWLWALRDYDNGQTRLISRVRARLSWRDSVMAILMEFADPIMMRKCLLNIADRANGTPAWRLALAKAER